jgi:hypothetical protein
MATIRPHRRHHAHGLTAKRKHYILLGHFLSDSLTYETTQLG